MKFKILILLLVYFTPFFAQSTENLFYGADKLIAELRELHAEKYSPINFQKGLELYNKAKELVKNGKSAEEIFPIIQDAESYFYKAKERSKINSDLFFYVSNLKTNAEKLCVDSKAAKPFMDAANTAFEEGISISENGGDIKEIKKKIAEAVGNYNAAKIIAKKENVFLPVVKLRTEARNLNADLFSPVNFRKAERYFETSLDFALKSNGEDFIKSILSAEKFYKKAINNSYSFSTINDDLLTAMKYARKSEAEFYATDTFEQAIYETKTAAAKFENGNKADAENFSYIATKHFWDAEKKSIYYKYIGKPKAEIDSLKQNGNLKGAEIPLRKAELYLAKAESLFEKNRYDKKIADLSKKTNRIIQRLKDISVIYSTRSQAYIDSLIFNELYPFGEKSFDVSYAQAKGNITGNNFEENKTSEKEKSSINKEKTPKSNNKNKLVTGKEVNKTKVKSPVESTAEYIRRVFKKKDAEIVEKGKSHLRIRLLGLKLKAYQKRLTASQKNYLMKLYNVIRYSKEVRKVIIEVYSDSKGGDALNKKLSRIRAKVVKKTLVKYGLNRRIVIAKGIGNKNPIASNATFEGRNKNRRIEVILLF